MEPGARRGSGWERSTSGFLSWLGVAGVAFGYIEAAVAHYLRMRLYPAGFDDSTVLVVDDHTLAVEIGRELCTLVLIIAVASLGKGPFIRRLASFVYLFAIWDLGYYAALWLFEGWPSSPCDWDLLFLLPTPWFGPVLAPMLISAIGLVGAVSVHLVLDRRARLVVPWHGCALVGAALALWEISFMAHGAPPTGFPTRYPWWLFALGVGCAIAGYLATWRRNASERQRRRGDRGEAGYEASSARR